MGIQRGRPLETKSKRVECWIVVVFSLHITLTATIVIFCTFILKGAFVIILYCKAKNI